MSFNEADFQTKFRRYAKNRLEDRTFLYELKVSKKDYINFKRLEKHQKYSLLAAKKGIAHHKIPDEGISQKPADGFQLCGVESLVGVMFNTKEQNKTFYLIDIEDWIEAREEVDRKSLTEEKAASIGETHELA